MSETNKKPSVVGVILSVLIAIVIFAIGIAMCTLIYLRDFAGKLSSADGMIQQVVEDVDLAQLDISAVSGKDQTLSEFVYDNLTDKVKEDVEIEDVEDLLNEEFISEFISDKLGDYSEDMLKGTGDGKITAEEVIELIDDNKEIIEDAGFDVDAYGYDTAIENFFEANDIEEKTSVKNIKEEIAGDSGSSEETVNVATVMSGIEFALSYKAIAAVAGVIVVLALFIFLLNRCTSRVFSYLGVVCLLLAVFNVAIFIAIPSLARPLNEVLELGIDTYKSMFASIKMQGLIMGGILLVVGAAFISIRQIVKKCVSLSE